jgi:hypothetical protein
MFGWQTLKQAEHYTKAADQKRLAASGMHLIGRKKRTKVPNKSKLENPLGKFFSQLDRVPIKPSA